MLELSGHAGRVAALAFGPDGTLASAADDGTVRLWDGPHCRAVLTGHAGRVTALAFGPHGLIASGSDDRTVRVWEQNPPATIFTSARLESPVTALAFLPGARLLMAVGTGARLRNHPGSLSLWELGKPTARQRYTDPSGVWSVAVAPGSDRTVAYSTGSRALLVWNPVAAGPSLFLVQKGGLGLAFSPDGQTLLSARDGALSVCDVPTRQERRALAGHTGRVDAVAVSPSGRTVISGGMDKTVRLWDAETGHPRAAYTWPTGRVSAVAVSPDGLLAAAAGDSGVIALWDVEE